ncbi:hypothetical protein Thein_2131 [Thermodesulfatator indicus DSM 15286]|uniref:General secretion pathway GspH domain-containing protein n=1 Tax=Thermodesulfatator indicus (strain DSM 15286 / JCM 11887 / CIR29812) TaxID=667014 RepID=F8ADG2_THEID|nr:prepilin-type N-terminal cleavage/methylation domain-containing protein [Thermodesulfatator indicus]AEH45979.1 hypothetical protein Thein_2131 [Thermodesulfatator indicus DSM 15286]
MRKGVTLLELLVVLFLISLLAGLIFPRVAALIPKENTFLVEAANFIEGARALALAKHQTIILAFDPKKRLITLKALSGETEKLLPKKLKVPEEIEIKERGLIPLPQGKWGIIFWSNGASSGGEVEIINRLRNKRLICRLARSQFLVEVRPE